jgi:hypothetical protein
MKYFNVVKFKYQLLFVFDLYKTENKLRVESLSNEIEELLNKNHASQNDKMKQYEIMKQNEVIFKKKSTKII